MFLFYFFAISSSFIVPIWNITSYEPHKGYTIGGDTVTINFRQSIQYSRAYCKFGEKTVIAQDIKSHSLKCVTPIHEPGTVDLIVTFDNNDWNMILPQTFTFIEPIKVKSINFLKFLLITCAILILLIGIYFLFRIPLTIKSEEAVPLLSNSNTEL